MHNEPRTLSKIEIEQRRKTDVEDHQRAEEEKGRREANYLTAQKICASALENGAWVYDPESKRWFTPQEFLELFGGYYADHKLFHRVKIKDPVAGIEAGYKQLENLKARLLAFSKKVIAYYASGQQL